MGILSLYKIAYNTAQWLGWTYIIYLTIMHYVEGGKYQDLYPKVQQPLVIFQTGAVLEIIHAILGVVPSPVFTTTLQVFSRLIILHCALEIGATDVVTHWGVTSLVLSWAAIEFLRYSYYAANEMGIVTYLHKWLRYSGFLPLYPTGITSEWVLLYASLPFVKENGVFSITLPNTYNVAFDWHFVALLTLFFVYPVGSYTMYTYMLKTRSKQLGGAAKKQKAL